MSVNEAVAVELEAVRDRTLDLVDLPEDDLRRQHSPLMSPLVWDLAHVGNYEELWLVREVGGHPAIDASIDPLYDAFRHPRPDRPSLPLLGPAEARNYLSDVRGRVLDVLETFSPDPAQPLLDGGFAFGMVIQHEHQHDETMLATRQLMLEQASPPPGTVPPPRPEVPYAGPAEVLVPGGAFTMGTDLEPWAYDNERPAHELDLAPFHIDAVPVTCGAFAEFVADGGYTDRRWWTDKGWSWREEAGVSQPEFWEPDGAGGWTVLRCGSHHPLVLDEPVAHVCWYEADAFARWAGKRLPTESEWERAASWGPDGRKCRWPWGDEPPDGSHANLGQRHDRPAAVGSYPAGASPLGVHQLIGDVWEWTSSNFAPYPGFRSFPYREYSEVFFGPEYKVLRGGSWATAPEAVRATFRNWDHPIRRQIFAGFRCARDAG
ncbi:MAG: gamma-glutamyl hercynylcysteine S-oxide synthase [Actinomycetota bacterium]|jgi:iron(II)-dependent oxidoreductase